MTNPGPSETNGMGFLAIGRPSVSSSSGRSRRRASLSNMVRLLSFKDAKTLRYSIVTVAIYYSVIYFSLVVIFCCARVLMPGMEIDPDRTMPDFAAQLTTNIGMPWLAGLLVAAPFAAVMSSVDSFLLVVSSAVVRDIYQGHINRDAPQRTIKLLSYSVTVIVGVLASAVRAQSAQVPARLDRVCHRWHGGLFFVPMVLSLYWRRMTSSSAIAGMIGGTVTHLALTYWGYLEYRSVQAYELLGMNPFIWDLVGSTLACLVAVYLGPKPEQGLIDKFFTK